MLVVVAGIFSLFASLAQAENTSSIVSASSTSRPSIGDSFLGEQLSYMVGFWIFDGIATGHLSFEREEDIFVATMRANATGLAQFVRSREDILVARMELAPGGARLRTLSFDRISKLGGKERRKLVEMDYDKGVLRWTKWKNGKLRKSGEHPIPEGVIYDDPLTAFYNLRYGVYGTPANNQAFIIKTFPSDEGEDIDMTVRFLTRQEAVYRRGEKAVGDGFLVDATLDKELFDSKSGAMEIYFSPDMVVTYVVAKDVLLFGDVRGRLLP